MIDLFYRGSLLIYSEWAIRSPATRYPYERRLIGFLREINLVPDDFVARAKMNSSSVEKMIITFVCKTKFTSSKRRNNNSHSWQLPEGRQIAFGDADVMSLFAVQNI